MAPCKDLLLLALRQDRSLQSLQTPEWELLVRQARHTGLLARLAHQARHSGQFDAIPEAPRAHLQAAVTFAAAQATEVRREVSHILKALEEVDTPVVLLKGAAYLMSGRNAAAGRTYSDVDIMVPKDRLPEVESALMLGGWITTHHSPYDQRYYRQWMHELPPMQHLQRQTVIDVHHAILPETARLKPNPGLLNAAAMAVDGHSSLRVLAPADMVLHSMTHLLHNDDLSHGLRDLSDIDLLLREFSADPDFWNHLVNRAEELDLARPLYYGLRLANAVFHTPVPAATLEDSQRHSPGWGLPLLMDSLWLHALCSGYPAAFSGRAPLTHFLLYLRAHWLRMPPALLARHLSVKAVRRLVPEEESRDG